MPDDHTAPTSHNTTATAAAGAGSPFVGDVASAQKIVGDRYSIIRLAGMGGMGSVFAAKDTLLHRTVAIKISRSWRVVDRDAAARERLVAEARAMAGLRHPNLCRVLEVAIDAAAPYMVMEWTDGIHLTDAARSMTIEERIALFDRVCSAVAAAHRATIAHRDLKPQNILVDSRGEPVVVDFGLARSSSHGAAGLTSAGTPGYAPPEQMMGEAQDWLRADVFSLGVILFELLTGRRPFEGATTSETARLMREEPIPLPEDLAPETPEAIQRVCLKALERSPADRYGDAAEMSQDLARYFRGETVAARPTQLAGRFHEYLEQQVLSARLWRKHGLITDRESERLIELLVDLQRPESPWVVDSRRLTLPQVSLYAGGWLILLGVTVGMGLVWDELDRTWLVRGAIFGAVLLMVLGVMLRRVGRELASVVHMMAGATVAPAAIWLMLRDTGWLADTSGASAFFAWVVREDHAPAGFGGRQLLFVGAVWCTLCMLMRWYTKAVSFSWLGALAAVGTWFAAWVTSGLFVVVDDRVKVEVWAQLALWMLAGGAAAIGPVVLLGWAEERAAGRVGPRRRRPRDSGPLLAACLLAIVGGLTGLAWCKPTWFGVPALFSAASHTMQHALAFMCSGVLQQALSYLLTVRAWRSGSRGASFLRWLVPNHICGALVYLHVDQTGSEGYAAIVWLVTLAAAALGFIGLSVVRQWKPFLFSGLGYLTVAYVRGFVLVDSYFPKAEVVPWARLAWQTALVAGALGLGLLVMLLAWAFPDLRRGVGSIASSTRLSRFRTRAGTNASPRG